MFRQIIKPIPHKFFKQFYRPISIVESYPIKDENGSVESIIFETTNNQDGVENSKKYRERSFAELATAIPDNLKNQDLLIAKINTSVIDSSKWLKTKEVTAHWTGHLITFLGRQTNSSLKPYQDLIVSKVPLEKPFQTLDFILNHEIITSQKRFLDASQNNSKEYFSFVSLKKTILTIEDFRARLLNIKNRNEPYDLINSACAQASYEVITGKRGSPKISAQGGYIKAIFEIVKKDDKIFINNLRNALSTSGLAKPADQLGKELAAKLQAAKGHNKPYKAS